MNQYVFEVKKIQELKKPELDIHDIELIKEQVRKEIKEELKQQMRKELQISKQEEMKEDLPDRAASSPKINGSFKQYKFPKSNEEEKNQDIQNQDMAKKQSLRQGGTFNLKPNQNSHGSSLKGNTASEGNLDSNYRNNLLKILG